MKTLMILGDRPQSSTGFAVVLRNLANELSRWFRVIYVGRFDRDKEFDKETRLLPNEYFEYSGAVGGVWDGELVVRILKHYEPDYVFSEDDFFSAEGLVHACNFWNIPFHFLNPLDSKPVPMEAFVNIYSRCDKVYFPNSSWESFNGKKRMSSSTAIIRAGEYLKSVYLPHGVDCRAFKPKKVPRTDKFTFVWIGRIEERKNPGAFLRAVGKVCDRIDADFLMRSDWNTPAAVRVLQYIQMKNLPIILDQMADIPHAKMCDVYNQGDMFVSTAKAGGFELSIIESAACSLPSIVCDWTYMNENVVHGKSGLLIPVESFCHPPKPDPREFRTSDIARNRIWGNISVDKLAERMVWSYLNQDMVKAMGRWAMENVRRNYKWKDVAEKLKDEILE